MLEIDVVEAPITQARVRQLVTVAIASAGVDEGHIAVTFLDPEQMAALNAEHRGVNKPTDVLCFPIDGTSPVIGERELGDVFVCQAYADNLDAVIIHGALHAVGMDHETDDGEMLALQAELVSWMHK